jgi:ABC-type molybdate transport system permease subunit
MAIAAEDRIWLATAIVREAIRPQAPMTTIVILPIILPRTVVQATLEVAAKSLLP